MMVSQGGHIREVGSTLRNKTGSWRTYKPQIDNNKCVDCGTCWIFCPDICITRTEASGRHEYKVNYDYCKGCGICANECPVEAIEMVLEAK